MEEQIHAPKIYLYFKPTSFYIYPYEHKSKLKQTAYKSTNIYQLRRLYMHGNV